MRPLNVLCSLGCIINLRSPILSFSGPALSEPFMRFSVFFELAVVYFQGILRSLYDAKSKHKWRLI